MYYRLVDLCVKSLLDQGLCLMEEANERMSAATAFEDGRGDD